MVCREDVLLTKQGLPPYTWQHRSSNQGAALEDSEPALHHRCSSVPKERGPEAALTRAYSVPVPLSNRRGRDGGKGTE